MEPKLPVPPDRRGLSGSAGEGPARGTPGLQKPRGRGPYGEKDLGHDGDRLRLGMDPRLNSMVMLEDKSRPKRAADAVILWAQRKKFTGHREIPRLLFFFPTDIFFCAFLYVTLDKGIKV